MDPLKIQSLRTIIGAEKLSVILEEGCAVRLLVLSLLPVILLSVFMVRQSIIFFAIGVPVLVLWIISAIVALIPDGLSSDPGK